MGVYYNLNYICDSCEQEFMVTDDSPSLPPHWLCIKVIAVNKNGAIPEWQDSDPFLHFCCHDCLIEFVKSEDFKEWVLMVDHDIDDNDDSEDLGENEKKNE